MSETEYDLTYLSLGCGVQSTTLLALACRGEIMKPDVAIFAICLAALKMKEGK
jgi:hypothetical protein